MYFKFLYVKNVILTTQQQINEDRFALTKKRLQAYTSSFLCFLFWITSRMALIYDTSISIFKD